MQLPVELKTKIEHLTQGLSLSKIQGEQTLLSSHYRTDRNAKPKLNSLTSEEQRLVYLITRFPATYAALSHVLEKIPADAVTSLLDVGAGPGTATLAAAARFGGLVKATLVEKDSGFIAMAKELVQDLVASEWVEADLGDHVTFPVRDLIIASYSLGELEEDSRFSTLEKLWQATRQFLVVLEPGTPFGFSQIKKIREFLISKNAHLLLPCPHANACPLPNTDWCHFLARLERSSLHRKGKLATLNYEDEKFCYVVFSKNPLLRCAERIIRRPLHQPGAIKLKVCSTAGVQEKIITKKNKESFKRAKKLRCGDCL